MLICLCTTTTESFNNRVKGSRKLSKEAINVPKNINKKICSAFLGSLK